MDKKYNNKKINIDTDDKKEKILYRFVRIFITLAVVLCVGYMATHVGENVEYAQTGENAASVQSEENFESTQSEEINEAADSVTDSSTDDIVEVADDIVEALDAYESDETFIEQPSESGVEVIYTFRNNNLLKQHYEKHGIEMGFESEKAYEEAASKVVNNPNALHKIEAEDGDDVYYVEDTNEFVIVSGDGYIRTYFLPNSGKAYYDRQ